MFQFTHPGKGATTSFGRCATGSIRFNSRTLGRVRLEQTIHNFQHSRFNSRTLGRVRRTLVRSCTTVVSGFNSRTLGRVRRSILTADGITDSVSIHAPWEGCDKRELQSSTPISSFQFTHPGKGATRREQQTRTQIDVSIHAPWEGCDQGHQVLPFASQVSIHAPWEGCDQL